MCLFWFWWCRSGLVRACVFSVRVVRCRVVRAAICFFCAVTCNALPYEFRSCACVCDWGTGVRIAWVVSGLLEIASWWAPVSVWLLWLCYRWM